LILQRINADKISSFFSAGRGASSLATRLIAQPSRLHAAQQYFLCVLLHRFSASGSIGFPQIGLEQASDMVSASR